MPEKGQQITTTLQTTLGDARTLTMLDQMTKLMRTRYRCLIQGRSGISVPMYRVQLSHSQLACFPMHLEQVEDVLVPRTNDAR